VRSCAPRQLLCVQSAVMRFLSCVSVLFLLFVAAVAALDDELLGKLPERGVPPHPFRFQGSSALLPEDVLGLANVSEALVGRQAGNKSLV
jgi:hypothetical protein